MLYYEVVLQRFYYFLLIVGLLDSDLGHIMLLLRLSLGDSLDLLIFLANWLEGYIVLLSFRL